MPRRAEVGSNALKVAQRGDRTGSDGAQPQERVTQVRVGAPRVLCRLRAHAADGAHIALEHIHERLERGLVDRVSHRGQNARERHTQHRRKGSAPVPSLGRARHHPPEVWK